MHYPYFDILFDMAKANVSQTSSMRLHFTRTHIQRSEYGPTMRDAAFYTTPEGDIKLERINRGLD